MKMAEIAREQREVCRLHRLPFKPIARQAIVGLARNFDCENLPLNGLRHPPSGDAAGWYIWDGQHLSDRDDFFEPVHAEHLEEICPSIMKYLALPPGARFLVAPNHEDIWFDFSLLAV